MIIYRFLRKQMYNNKKKAFGKVTKKNNNNNKNKKKVLSLPETEGGLNMINTQYQQKMFLAKWTSELVQNKEET